MSVINFSGVRNHVLALFPYLFRAVRRGLPGWRPFLNFLVLWIIPVGLFATALLALAGDLRGAPELEIFLAAPEFAAVSLGFCLVCFALERCAPYRAEWNRLGRSEANDWWLYLSALAPAEFLARTLAFALCAPADHGAGGIAVWLGVGAGWPTSWPFMIQLVMALLVFDFVYYWYHRLSHRDGFLWRWHRLHHTPEYLIAQKSFRHSFPEWGADVLVHTLVFLLLGVPADVVLALYAITIPIGVLSHANLDVPNLRWLSDWLNLPGTHRVHHDRELHGGTSNFSAFTMIWDHVFGTFVSPREYEPAALGLHALPSTGTALAESAAGKQAAAGGHATGEPPIPERPLALWASFM